MSRCTFFYRYSCLKLYREQYLRVYVVLARDSSHTGTILQVVRIKHTHNELAMLYVESCSSWLVGMTVLKAIMLTH